MNIDEQIICVKREVNRRKKHYPRMAEEGKLPKDMAAAETARMQAVLETLTQLKGLVGR